MKKIFASIPSSIRPVRLIAATAFLACAGPAAAADVYGRVYDTLRGQLYPGAQVTLVAQPAQVVRCDEQAGFRFKDVPPGVYLVRLALPDSSVFTSRLLVSGRTPTTIADLDLSRINPPDEDDEY